MDDWTSEQIDSMAACLFGEAIGITWTQAKRRIDGPPAEITTFYRRLAQRALDHLHYLPGNLKYLLDPSRVDPSRRPQPIVLAPYHWLGVDAEPI